MLWEGRQRRRRRRRGGGQRRRRRPRGGRVRRRDGHQRHAGDVGVVGVERRCNVVLRRQDAELEPAVGRLVHVVAQRDGDFAVRHPARQAAIRVAVGHYGRIGAVGCAEPQKDNGEVVADARAPKRQLRRHARVDVGGLDPDFGRRGREGRRGRGHWRRRQARRGRGGG